MTGTRTSVGAPTRTSFTPSLDQSSVNRLQMTVQTFVRIADDRIAIFVICGGIGFPVTICSPNAPDFEVGQRIIAEYPKGENPLRTTFTALYPATDKPLNDSSTDAHINSIEIARATKSTHDAVLSVIDRLAQDKAIVRPVVKEVPTTSDTGAIHFKPACIFTGEQGRLDSILVAANLHIQPAKGIDLPDITNTNISMTSLEIAELVESRHDNVRITVQRLAEKGVITLPAMQEKPTAGRPSQVYVFTGEQGKRDSIIVVAQLSPEFTAKLVDRWQELEKQLAQPKPPAELSRMEVLKLAMESEEARLKAESERDEAIRTKAMIGSSREAKAMATASKAVREANKLRHELGRNQHHATVTAVEQVAGKKFPRNAYVPMRSWCKRNGINPVNVVDERYGLVKAWPAGAWLDCHDIDLSELFGHPQGLIGNETSSTHLSA